MTDTPLIRRQVTADRGVRAVTTREVLECIKSMSAETFSTRDIADALIISGLSIDYTRLEYSVRQAVTWLMRRGFVDRTKDQVLRYTRANEPYWARVYVRVEPGAPCDVALLNRIFFGV